MVPKSLFIYLFIDFFHWGGKWGAEDAITILLFDFITIYFVSNGLAGVVWAPGRWENSRSASEQVPTAPRQFHFLQQGMAVVEVVTSILNLHQTRLHPQIPPNPRHKTACNIFPLLHNFHVEKAELWGFWNGCLISALLARNDPVAPSNYTINLWEGYKAIKAVVMVCNLIAEL